ncbi:MAG TPA: serine/threonine-protein kinase, partial [Kofleriaceae bacterium]|nr:serine/threonine-protein kinase [Kofleriaceae bacterium]
MGAQARLGRYELITRIGQGGMAEVQLALQRGPAGFEKLVVVKLVHGELATQKAFVDMLLDEARVAALVKHPNVVDIYDLGEADGKYFIAMEYLEGEPLLSVLRAGREGKRLDPLSTARLIADTAEGLDAAHELRSMAGERLELVHHDISLGNIVVLYNGSVKLVDFGVAKANQTVSGPKAKVQGKFSYMAPEKLKGSPGDRRSDIFSLGCVMWEALTLKRLFRGGNDADTMKQVLGLAIQLPSKVNPDVPPELDPIVMRALDRDPAKRQATAKHMADAIEEVLLNRGYGARNDRIAKYMQDTFKDHIEARKKLVQEVVSKGSASAEIVDAAFAPEMQIASGSPRATRGDFSVVTPLPLRPSLPNMVPLKAAAPSSVVPDAFSDHNRPTEISPSIFDGATEIAPPPIEDPDLVVERPVTGTGQPSKIVSMMDWIEDIAMDKRKRTIAYAIAAGAVLVLVIVLMAKCGAHSAATTSPPDAAPSVVPPPLDIDAAIAVESPTPAASDAAVAIEPPIVVDAGVAEVAHPHVPVVPHVNADAQFQKAFQAFVKGDARGALALLKVNRAQNPN